MAKGRRFSRSDAAAKWGEFTAPGGSVLGEEAGGGDGAVDGAAGTDIVEDGLVSRGEFDLVHEDLIPVNTITSERAEPRRREGWSSCRPMKWKGLVGQKIVRSPVTGFWRGRKRHRGRGEPAFRAAEQLLPRNQSDIIDGFNARNGIIREGYQGTLSAPPKVRPRPFEIILETPHAAPQFLQEKALVAALLSILTEYRRLISYAPNL